MIAWIESHDTPTVALLAFALSYALAALIFVAAVAVSRRRIAAHVKATSPVMLTPLSVIAGLLIAFLASRVWTNFDHANAYAAEEASAIREFTILAGALPNDERTSLGSAIKDYLHFVESLDWPAMKERRASLKQAPPGLTEAMEILLSFVPAQPGQRLAQQRAVVALERASEARRDRIILSQATIAPLQWIVVFILAALVLVTVAMVHVERPATTALNRFVFSTAVGASPAILMVYDAPFAAGGNSVEPTVLRDIGLD